MDGALYLLSDTSLEMALTRFLQKAISLEKKALVVFETQQYMDHINDILWSPRNIVIPHARNTDPYPEEQPVLLTLDGNNTNNASIVVFLEESTLHRYKEAERLVIFNHSFNEARTDTTISYFAQQKIPFKLWREEKGKWVLDEKA